MRPWYQTRAPFVLTTKCITFFIFWTVYSMIKRYDHERLCRSEVDLQVLLVLAPAVTCAAVSDLLGFFREEYLEWEIWKLIQWFLSIFISVMVGIFTFQESPSTYCATRGHCLLPQYNSTVCTPGTNSSECGSCRDFSLRI